MNIASLLKSKKTAYTVQQLGQILETSNIQVVRNQLSRWKKKGVLQNPYGGIWTLPGYSKYELANILKSPSYISLETILSSQGIVF